MAREAYYERGIPRLSDEAQHAMSIKQLTTTQKVILLAALLLCLLVGAGGYWYKQRSAAESVSSASSSGPQKANSPQQGSTAQTPTQPAKQTDTAKKDTKSAQPAPTAPGAASPSGGTSGSGGVVAGASTLHYTANINNQALAISLGFNLLDMGPTKSLIDALPNGVQALVWLGNIGNASIGSPCPAPSLSLATFQSKVDALATDPKVYGFYISDEPHPAVCPNAAADIRERADYIHAHAPGKKAFIVVLDGSNACSGNLGCEYEAFNPSNTHVDYIGLDPYPCHYAGDGVAAVACDNSAITTKVNLAISKGIPASSIIPTFQTFGQAGRTDGKTVYYRMPTTTELQSMLSTWKSVVPSPAFDYSYSFGVQCGSSCPAPQAVENHSEIQTVLTNYFKQ